MTPDTDDSSTADPAAEAEAAERRRLIDLTRREKGLPERRHLRRSQPGPDPAPPSEDPR